MSNKCEWKDRELFICEGMRKIAPNKKPRLEQKNSDGKSYLLGKEIFYCPFCGADIRKPVEKPLIVKSGGTWVANFEGVDYLILNPNWWAVESTLMLDREIKKFKDEIKTGRWIKPFSEITLTDEIAKLRPMVVFDATANRGRIVDKLVWVDGKELLTVQGWNGNNICRLATPHELQEADNGK